METEQVAFPRGGEHVGCGNTVLVTGTGLLYVRGAAGPTRLSRSECVLMEAFLRAPGNMLSVAELMHTLFRDRRSPPRPPILRTFVHQLRQHLADTGSDLSIVTWRSYGWYLVAPPHVPPGGRVSLDPNGLPLEDLRRAVDQLLAAVRTIEDQHRRLSSDDASNAAGGRGLTSPIR